MKNIVFNVVLALMIFSFAGCVRLAGGAGYWHTDSEGEVKSKQMGFDTQNLVSGDRAPGSIQ